MNILLFGPPGAGKGTQSEFLISREKMKHISTGNLLRESIKNQTKLGLEAKKFMDAGQLVPDSVVIGMVEEELKKIGKTPFILDGFPRTVAQGEALDAILNKMDLPLGKAIFLDVAKPVLLERLSGRRVCQGCGAVYHVKNQPPKRDGVCDKCGKAVVQRDDDKESAVQVRLEVYDKSTAPLKDYYKSAGKYEEVNGLGETEEVFARIKRVLKSN